MALFNLTSLLGIGILQVSNNVITEKCSKRLTCLCLEKVAVVGKIRIIFSFFGHNRKLNEGIIIIGIAERYSLWLLEALQVGQH